MIRLSSLKRESREEIELTTREMVSVPLLSVVSVLTRRYLTDQSPGRKGKQQTYLKGYRLLLGVQQILYQEIHT